MSEQNKRRVDEGYEAKRRTILMKIKEIHIKKALLQYEHLDIAEDMLKEKSSHSSKEKEKFRVEISLQRKAVKKLVQKLRRLPIEAFTPHPL